MTFGTQQRVTSQHETGLAQFSVSVQLSHLCQSIICSIPRPLDTGMLGGPEFAAL